MDREVFERKIRLYITLHANDINGIHQDYVHEKNCTECRKQNRGICHCSLNFYTIAWEEENGKILFMEKNKQYVRELIDLWVEEKYPSLRDWKIYLGEKRGAEYRTICFGFLNTEDQHV